MLPSGMPATSLESTPERNVWVAPWPLPKPWSRFENTVNDPRSGSSGVRFGGSAAARPSSAGKNASWIMPKGLATQTNRRMAGGSTPMANVSSQGRATQAPAASRKPRRERREPMGDIDTSLNFFVEAAIVDLFTTNLDPEGFSEQVGRSGCLSGCRAAGGCAGAG